MSARDQILETASALFFKHGYRAVGVDTIIAESGVAKATLYRHFPSKDDLITAYLELMNEQFWEWFDNAANRETDPIQQIIAVFEALEKLVTTPTCYGCPFLIAATEFPEQDYPGHQVAVANKQAVRERLHRMCEAADVPNPAGMADLLYLVMDGAFMATRVFGVNNPAVGVAERARFILNR